MIRRFIGLLIVALLGVSGTGGRVHAAIPAPRVQSGTEYVATCLQSARSLSALFMFDQSGSLGQTDPSGVRYDGLKVALDSLARVGRADGQKVAVEAAVAAFDDNYDQSRRVVPWTRLSGLNVDDMDKTVGAMVRKARDRTQPNGGTNFTAALQGAFSDLKDRGGRGSCKVVFWFTDGQDGANTISSAPCQAGSGLVDALRKNGIVVVGLQLGPRSTDLQAIATGTSPRSACGQTPIPTDWASGLYIQANDTNALRRLFGGLGNLVRGCTAQGSRGGRIDPGVGGFSVTINTPSQVRAVRLDAPDGTVITATARGSSTQGGYKTLAQSDSAYVTVTVDFPPGKGAGLWTVSAGQATSPSDVQFCVYSGLHLVRVTPKASPLAGSLASVEYHAVDGMGVEADLSAYKSVGFGAGVVAADGSVRKTTAVRRGNWVVAQVSTQPTDARLQLKLSVQPITVSGLALTPLVSDEAFGLTLSKAYPAISPISQLDLGSAKRTDIASAGLTLLGSPIGPSQVCFAAPTDIHVPQEAAGTKIAGPQGCVSLKQGETRVLRISVKPRRAAVGSGDATLPITLVPSPSSGLAGHKALINLPIVWRFENPENAVVLWLVVLTAAALSVLLPLLAIGLAGFVTARFEVSDMRYEVIPVVVGDGGPRRSLPSEAHPERLLDTYDMRLLPEPSRRRFRVDTIEFESKASFSPFKAPRFSVRSLRPGDRLLSSVPPPEPHGASALATPGLGFFAAVVVAEADLGNRALAEVPGTLVVLLRDKKLAPQALDSILNSRIDWSIITERWRDGVDVVGPRDGDASARTTRDYSHLDRSDDGTGASSAHSHLDDLDD